MLIPAAIETTRRSVPADLRRASWDARRMTADTALSFGAWRAI